MLYDTMKNYIHFKFDTVEVKRDVVTRNNSFGGEKTNEC